MYLKQDLITKPPELIAFTKINLPNNSLNMAASSVPVLFLEFRGRLMPA